MKKYEKFEGHTPGPWVKGKFTTVTKSNGEKIVHKTGPEGQSVQSQQRNYDRRLVDSNLIAAAPDLLAACKRKNKLLEMLVETHDNLVKEAKFQEPDENEIAMKHALFLIAVGNIREELDREGI